MPDWRAEIERRLSSLKLDSTRESDIIEELAQHVEDRQRVGKCGEPIEHSSALGGRSHLRLALRKLTHQCLHDRPHL